jgi:hypothetical protein
MCDGAQNVFDLGRFCQTVQVRCGRRVAGATCRFPSSLARHFLRSLVRCQRAGSLVLRPLSSFGERPRRLYGYTRPSVARVTLLEERQYLLGALGGIASDHPEVLRTQLDLAGLVRQVLIVRGYMHYAILAADETLPRREAPLTISRILLLLKRR